MLAVGPLPPPIHGAAATTQLFVAYASQHVPLRVANIARGVSPGLRGHAVKAGRVLKAIFDVAAGWRESPRRVLYMALDGQRGLAYNICLAMAGRCFSYAVIVHHHSFAYIDQRSRLMEILAWVMGPKGTHIVACDCMTDGLRRRYARFANAPMVELTSAAFVDVFPGDTFRVDDTLRIGFLSNMIIEKGLDTSIELLRAATREQLPVKLLLAGRSIDPVATALIEAAGREFGTAIEYLGPLSQVEKDQFYQDVDVISFPTRYVNESQPRAILEALSYGLPVLTTARGCIGTDVGPGCGLCVSPPDADFVSAVLPLVRAWCADRESLRRSSAEARDRAMTLYANGQTQLSDVVDAIYAR